MTKLETELLNCIEVNKDNIYEFCCPPIECPQETTNIRCSQCWTAWIKQVKEEY